MTRSKLRKEDLLDSHADALRRSGLPLAEQDESNASFAEALDRPERVREALAAVELGHGRSADEIQADLLASYATHGVEVPKGDLRQSAEMLSILSGPRLLRLPRITWYCLHWLVGYLRGHRDFHVALLFCTISMAISTVLLAAAVCTSALVGGVIGIVLDILWVLSAAWTTWILFLVVGLAWVDNAFLSKMRLGPGDTPRDDSRLRRLQRHRRRKRKHREAGH
jgi:hypothetical protein